MIGQRLQSSLTTPTLRLYRTTDTIGAELGGALKNVIAIGCGAVMGAGLGESARAALMTRGFAEMHRFAHALGAQPDTLAGLSGFGDLVLTCTSPSRATIATARASGAVRRSMEVSPSKGPPPRAPCWPAPAHLTSTCLSPMPSPRLSRANCA